MIKLEFDVGDDKLLPYYKLEKTEECKQFFFANDGYFNFWDEYLILRIASANYGNVEARVLVNRTGCEFTGKDSMHNIEAYNKELNESINSLEPEQMYKDFPELLERIIIVK